MVDVVRLLFIVQTWYPQAYETTFSILQRSVLEKHYSSWKKNKKHGFKDSKANVFSLESNKSVLTSTKHAAASAPSCVHRQLSKMLNSAQLQKMQDQEMHSAV